MLQMHWYNVCKHNSVYEPVSLQVFQVRAEGDSATDAAYTTDDLLLHSDQNIYESSPGVEFLFCLR